MNGSGEQGEQEAGSGKQGAEKTEEKNSSWFYRFARSRALGIIKGPCDSKISLNSGYNALPEWRFFDWSKKKGRVGRVNLFSFKNGQNYGTFYGGVTLPLSRMGVLTPHNMQC